MELIQQILLGILLILIFYNLGFIHLNPITHFIQGDGYESDEEITVKRHKNSSSKRKSSGNGNDRYITPITEILQSKSVRFGENIEELDNTKPWSSRFGVMNDEDDPEFIQRSIMNELNHHRSQILTPAPI
jgi:capsular polysaccharide biosynthesis protein